MRVVGVHYASGYLYFGYLEASLDGRMTPISGAPRRVGANAGLSPAERLADLAQRVEQDFRATTPAEVIVVATRQHGNWVYKAAFDRVLNICAVMTACTRLQVPCVEVKTEAIGRRTSTPAARLQDIPHELFGFDSRPIYWTAGLADAFGAAAIPFADVS